MSVRSWSADDPDDKARVKEAIDMAKRIDGGNSDLAAWAAKLLRERDDWQVKRRQREQHAHP